MSPDVDALVVGGGVIGLAVAASLARAGRSVVLLERQAGFAREVTSRNSEVVHAGIYYPAGSLKATLCVAGREALYERCEELRIPHRRIGKIIVATADDELAILGDLQRRGEANGAPGLEVVSAAEVRRLEPALRARAGLISPASGIVDAHALSLSYAAEAESHGATLLLRTEVVEIDRQGDAYRVTARGPDGGVSDLRCAAVVNAAGLAADAVAERAGFDVDARGYRLYPCKGDYFGLAPGTSIELTRLVYPVPSGPGLGIHATPDLAGRIRFGPDAEFVDALDFDVDPDKASAFSRAVARYLPQVTLESLAPEMSGIRPRLAGPGEGFRDFVVAEESAAGWPGFVNCLGIESPGLTAAPAIAERVRGLLAGL